MKRLGLSTLAAGAAMLAFATPASASLDLALPTNAYISFGGLDWAWISPCSPVDPSCGDTNLFDFQGSLGWRLPTAAEFALRPQASDFLFAGANVPDGGTDPISGAFFDFGDPNGDGACATPYFADVWTHCDWNNGVDGFIYNAGAVENGDYFETWAVRPSVPEPGTWAMMLLGFGAIGAALRRRRRPAIGFATV